MCIGGFTKCKCHVPNIVPLGKLSMASFKGTVLNPKKECTQTCLMANAANKQETLIATSISDFTLEPI